MEEQIVETYLKAKKEQRRVDILVVLSLTALAVLIGLDATGKYGDYIPMLGAVSMILMMGSVGGTAWVKVSRQQLVETLGHAITRDAEGIQILAAKNKH